MGVRRESKRDVATRMHERYLKAKGRKGRGRLLDESVALTGYDRVYAQTLLEHGPRREPRPSVHRGPIRRRAGRPEVYGPQVVRTLKVRGSPGLGMREAPGGYTARVGAGVGAGGCNLARP